MLIARTDAPAVRGLGAAIDRAHAALDACAHITFVEAPPDMAAVEAIASRMPGHKMFKLATGGRSPALSFAALVERGFGLVVVPGLALMPRSAA
ncbi:MAG: hypothetical protein C0482_28885 [Gordonia sp.]|nr:hypothetical protein [Gordonia sp. (in: high G+C Gram-positive bacteria)]